MSGPERFTETTVAQVGDPVQKIGGDYTFEGTIQCVFYKRSGKRRFVVEDDRGILHIFSASNLAWRDDGSDPFGEVST